MLQKAFRKRRQWQNATVLIVDEISMIAADLFDKVFSFFFPLLSSPNFFPLKVEYIARKIRHSELPFGGLQLVLCGDFLQLPPVDKGFGQDRKKFCFEAESWPKCIDICVELTHIFRQKVEFFIFSFFSFFFFLISFFFFLFSFFFFLFSFFFFLFSFFFFLFNSLF